MTKTVAVVFGTRPEAIKLAPVVTAFRADARVRTLAVAAAQHRQMLDQVLEAFGLTPDADLNLMQPGQTLAGLTARGVVALDEYFATAKPDLVVVQGDTTTVLAAALAAFYRKIPVAHVEAGLRTGDMQSPWPEEANRVLTTRLATLHFAPTPAAAENLIREGIPPGRVFVTGNTVIDALLHTVRGLDAAPVVVPGLPPDVLSGRRIVLITGHRRENFGAGFDQMCGAIADLAARFPDVAFVYPVHLNPNVREPVGRVLAGRPNVYLLEPLGYREFIDVFRRCTLVLTDSGGVQEEAPTLNKPVLVMRSTTERPEGVQAGAVKLVGPDRPGIVAATTELLTDKTAYRAMTGRPNPYGDGFAARRIVAACGVFLGGETTPGSPWNFLQSAQCERGSSHPRLTAPGCRATAAGRSRPSATCGRPTRPPTPASNTICPANRTKTPFPDYSGRPSKRWPNRRCSWTPGKPPSC